MKVKSYNTYAGLTRQVKSYLPDIFETPHVREGKAHFISRLYWMTTGNIRREAERGFTELSEKWKGRDMELWSGSRFVWDVHKRGWNFLIEELHGIQLRAAKQQHADRGEGVFAAYCAYLSALWHLGGEVRDNDAASACLQEAVGLIDRDERKSFYYFLSMCSYYQMLDDLLMRFPALNVVDLGLLNGAR